MRNTKYFQNIDVVIRLYNSFVRPHLEYASTVWCPTTDYHKELIEKVQKKISCLPCLSIVSVLQDYAWHIWNAESPR